ncbi:hypothetical protein C7I55_16565 [Sphingomonas deserti]|uniref:Uncharacterized protein n=1 Tax=Allosphingosinicella deserti TaxID=2116704 RepID=A0A2P7QLV8_9SPHN|nr:hypothetical protein C7I55_16565 [Sphingomonas deserti]
MIEFPLSKAGGSTRIGVRLFRSAGRARALRHRRWRDDREHARDDEGPRLLFVAPDPLSVECAALRSPGTGIRCRSPPSGGLPLP